MAGISSKAAGGIQNRYKFNGGNELQSGEFSDGSGLEMYDAVHRMYDPQLGRFFQLDELAESNWEMSPYNFASDNPINFNDPLGLADADPKDDPTGKLKETKTLATVSVSAVKQVSTAQMHNLYWQLKDSGKGFGGVKSDALRHRLENYDYVQNFMRRVHAQQRKEEMMMLEIGSMFLPLGWITKLRYVKYAATFFKLRRGASVGKPLITVLGRQGRYEKVAFEMGYNKFIVKEGEKWTWEANLEFLEKVAARGDEIILTNSARTVEEGTVLAKEIEFFVKEKGYNIAKDGMSLYKL